MANAGRISVSFDAGTSQFQLDVKKATATLEEFGHAGVTNVQAISGGLRVLDGNITQNIRSAERFLATLPGLGAAFQAAFPVIGAIAVAGLLFELIKRANELAEGIQKVRNASQNIDTGFQKLAQRFQVGNDELDLTNAKLQNEINKLENKPQNGLAVALAEARVQADKLAESLNRDLEEVEKLLKENEVGFFKSFVGGARTDDVTKEFEQDIQKLNKITEDGRRALDSASPGKEANVEASTRRQIYQELASDLQKYQAELDLAKKKQDEFLHPKVTATPGAAADSSVFSSARTSDQSARISSLNTAIGALQAKWDEVSKRATNAYLAGRKALDDANKPAKEKTDYFGDAVSRLNADIAGARDEQSAAGGSRLTEAIARGAAKATEEVRRMNLELAKANEPALTKGQDLQIFGLNTQLSITQFIAQEKDKAAAKEIENSKRAQEEDTRRIGALIASTNVRAEKEQEIQNRIGETLAKLDAEQRGIQYKIAAVGGSTEQIRAAELAAAAAKASAEKPEYEGQTASQRIQQAQQLLQLGYQYQDAVSGKNLTATQGFRQYFQDLANNTQSAGSQVKTVLGGAFQGLDKQLTDLITGQKTSFSSFFRGIAADIANAGLNSLFAGISSSLLKPGGGGLGSLLSSLFGGFKAEGGPLDSGKWYIAGEHGPEPVWGGGSGAFATGYGNAMSSRGGDTYIDARGSENSAATEARINRAVNEARQQGARDGARLSRESRARVPNSKAWRA